MQSEHGAARGIDIEVTPATEPEEGSSQRLPQTGDRIRHYEIIRELGRGGMGAVYLARDTRLGRKVAVKFLHSDQPELTARFLLEARATARCGHENIVIIHEVGEHGGNPFMVLEYLQGTPLGTVLRGGRTLPPARAVEIIVPVVRALVAAHAHNIVHRDLKPDNIVITDAGTIKVLDFGIAKLLHEPHAAGPARAMAEVAASLAPGDDDSTDPGSGAELTGRGSIVGTLPYMSPEQWGMDTVDHRTDLWAVGILLFRMLAGKHPLAPRTGAQLAITAMLEEPMPRVRDACKDLPAELAAVIDRCLIKPKEQRVGSARELLEALEPLMPGRMRTQRLAAHESPYAGLCSFQEADASRFFGRAREIAAAVTRLRDQPLLGVIGPSGVGKSSFVRAGVMPALKQSGEPWSTIVVRPGRQPLAALAQVIAPMISQSSTTVASDLSELHAVHQQLTAEPGHLGAVLRSRARHRGERILVFVDQFEELYTLGAGEHERRAFTACLASVADDATTPLRVILSIRSDFLDRVAEDPRFMAELTGGLFFLTPPSRDGLGEAITLPAEMAGYQLESRTMVEDMLDHLEHAPGALPLLQFTAARLWDMRDAERRLLTDASYREIGGIVGALASHADAVLAELPRNARSLARTLLLHLVTSERTRQVVSVEELRGLARDPDEVQRLVDHLVQARLLVVQTGGAAGASVEIVHESLIHGWPLLRRWLDENQDDAVFLDELRSAARQWDARGRPTGLLWRGEAMDEARRWYRRYRGELPEVQRAFIEAIVFLGTRAARRRRAAVVAVIGVLSLLVAAAAVALVVIRDAQKESVQQAAAARRAEKQVRDQLEAIEAERAAREQAELKALAAKEAAERANHDLRASNDELVRSRAELVEALQRAEEARARAESAKRRARRDRRKAEQYASEARRAEAEAQRARREYEVLWEREKERVRRLQNQMGTTVIDDISTQ